MKNEDLWIPFDFKNRRPFFMDRFLYVPSYYFEHEKFSLPCFKSIFNNTHLVQIEFCSGNGEWVIQQALTNSFINWIAVEKRLDRAKKIWKKMERENLENLLVVCADALTFAEHYLKENQLCKAYINFPDPWPKKKHQKHRLMQKRFIDLLYRVLTKKANAIVVTDEESYRNEIIKNFLTDEQWKSAFSAPYFTDLKEDFGTSFFERLWKSKKRTIHYMQFTKDK